MASKPAHLIERAAQRLQEAGAQGGPDLLVAPERLEEVESAPLPARPLQPEVTPLAREPNGQEVDCARLEQAGMISWGNERTRISEEFRIAQGQILRTVATSEAEHKERANLVMVTSSRPDEGKSFVALNLAASIARLGGREVVLVDADAKMHSLSAQLGLTAVSGLLDLAADPMRRAEDMLVTTSLPLLCILPIGADIERRGEISASTSVANALTAIGRRFPRRVIVLDTPPCLSSSEPSMLAPLVGQIVLVVEAERTQQTEVEASLDLIQTCPTITLLLNKIQLTTRHTFGAYYS